MPFMLRLDSRFVEIFASNEINPAYYFLSKSLDHRYVWVCGDGDGLFPLQFSVEAAHVVAALKQLGIHSKSSTSSEHRGKGQLSLARQNSSASGRKRADRCR